MERTSVAHISGRKNTTPIVVLTAYTAPMARILDPHIDILLVGDSMGMVLYGMENTRGMTLDMMIAHTKSVVGASSHALVVIDMPYGSYQESPAQALENCRRALKESGAQAVKLEAGAALAGTIKHLVDNGVPVMGHVGLMPQQVTEAKGYRYQGRTSDEAEGILQDALAIEKAGVFCMVIEAVKEDASRMITGKLRVPTIGIGASPACDGQVLVTEDMLGLSGRTPGFVKHYADLASIIGKAVESYAQEVKSRKFPSDEYCFTGKKKS